MKGLQYKNLQMDILIILHILVGDEAFGATDAIDHALGNACCCLCKIIEGISAEFEPYEKYFRNSCKLKQARLPRVNSRLRVFNPQIYEDDSMTMYSVMSTGTSMIET